MEIMTAFGKPSDLKVCSDCGRINWYDNTECICINCNSNNFLEDKNSVSNAIAGEYTFYMNEEGMTEEEVDHILIEV